MIWLAALGWLLAASLAALALTLRRRLECAARAEHELRGPLAALALGVEQVRRGQVGSELAGALEAQLDRARAGLTDLTAALGGGEVARSARDPSTDAGSQRGVPLERLARDTAAGWASVAARGGRSVRFDWRAGPVRVAADRGRLAQALGNLLSNAIEHGDGEVELRGWRVGDAVRVEVADRGGAGRLARAGSIDGAPARRSGRDRYASPRLGRGRGLGVATRAVEESGGRLEIVTGQAGTTAALELPLEDR